MPKVNSTSTRGKLEKCTLQLKNVSNGILDLKVESVWNSIAVLNCEMQTVRRVKDIIPVKNTWMLSYFKHEYLKDAKES